MTLFGSRRPIAAIGLIVLAMLGCQPGLNRQPKVAKPDAPSAFFRDGRSTRPIEPGTVARGQLQFDAARSTGLNDAGQPVAEFPVAVTDALVKRGRERFNIFCSQCHGRLGVGDGKVVLRGYVKPPNLHTDLSRGLKLRGQEVMLTDVSVGYLFNVITAGYGAMPDYADLVPPDDRWAIVAYVRALQLTAEAGGD
jgi:mono/diheme cytochrome c family protein